MTGFDAAITAEAEDGDCALMLCIYVLLSALDTHCINLAYFKAFIFNLTSLVFT